MNRQPRRIEPETREEIIARIHELEDKRIKLPHYPHCHVPLIRDNITTEINRLYEKLELLEPIERQEKHD